MTLEQALYDAVELAVRRVVEPARQELEKPRAEPHAQAISVTEGASHRLAFPRPPSSA